MNFRVYIAIADGAKEWPGGKPFGVVLIPSTEDFGGRLVGCQWHRDVVPAIRIYVRMKTGGKLSLSSYGEDSFVMLLNRDIEVGIYDVETGQVRTMPFEDRVRLVEEKTLTF